MRIHLFACVLALVSFACLSAEEAKKEAPPPEKKKPVDDESKQRLAETLSKMDELERKWQAGQKNKPSSDADKRVRKAAAEEEKARKKERERAEKAVKHGGSDSGAAAVSSGERREGSVEMGGLTSSSSSSASSGWGSAREGSSRGTSMSVRTTVIRLDGPSE
jgi:hypothetical protein